MSESEEENFDDNEENPHSDVGKPNPFLTSLIQQNNQNNQNNEEGNFEDNGVRVLPASPNEVRKPRNENDTRDAGGETVDGDEILNDNLNTIKRFLNENSNEYLNKICYNDGNLNRNINALVKYIHNLLSNEALSDETYIELIKGVLTIDAIYRHISYSKQYEDFDLHTPKRIIVRKMKGVTNKLIMLNRELRVSLSKPNDKFLECLFEDFNIRNHLLVAGGYIQQFITGHAEYHEGDVDMFIYGYDNVEEANSLILEIVEKFEELSEMPIYYSKSGAAITLGFQDKSIHYQIILRLYKTKSEILHGFDLGSSSVGYDGEKYYFTTLSLFTFMFQTNIVDLTKRSRNYEYRLLKYYERGFQIFLPGCSDKNNLKLPKNCGVICYNGVIHRDNKLKVRGDYEEDVHECIRRYFNSNSENKKPYEVNLVNVTCLLSEEYQRCITVSEDFNELLVSPFEDNTFSKCNIEEIYEMLIRSLLRKKKRCIGQFTSIQKFSYYFKEFAPQIIQLQLAECRDVDAYMKVIEPLISKLQNIADNGKDWFTSYHWITENPGKQILGSINPVETNISDWYGKTYERFDIGCPWDKQRLLWIGFLKKDDHNAFSIFGKDIIIYIILCYRKLVEYDTLPKLLKYLSVKVSN